MKYGRLTVLGEACMLDRSGRAFFCLCDCGRTTLVRGGSLRRGSTKSCGCLRKETERATLLRAATKHGHTKHDGTKSRTYRIWQDMRARCENPREYSYRWYGARGIVVCDRWADFKNFLADVGEIPDGLSIDRIDVNGDYEPGNVRLADQATQVRNRRVCRPMTFNGETKTVQEWARHFGIARHTVLARLHRGRRIDGSEQKALWLDRASAEKIMSNFLRAA